MRNAPALAPAPRVRRFGRFELRPHERAFFADGVPVALGARAFDLLVAFVDRPGTLITKDDLLATVWPGLVVEENNLQVQVSTLRKILGQSALVTIPGRGYRFTMEVMPAADADVAVPAFSPDAPTVSEPGGTKAPSTPGNLPGRLPSLFGRAEDVAAIVASLRQHSVVTITGAGGIGKTRVAQAVAKSVQADYPDGVWWVELASLADGALVA